MCHLCLLKYKCYLGFSLLFYLIVSALLKTNSGYLQTGRCLEEQRSGGAVGRESNEMDFLLFESLVSPGGARRERAGEKGRSAARSAAGSFPLLSWSSDSKGWQELGADSFSLHVPAKLYSAL